MQYGKKLGEGSYGKVYESLCKKYAIKIITCCLCKSIYKELYFSNHLCHENILQSEKIKITKSQSDYCIELYYPKKNINLQKYLLQTENILYETKLKFMSQILNSVEYLHKQNICHKDLKLDNFLVDKSSLTLSLIDFGSTSYNIVPILKHRICALWLQPPEILNFKVGQYDIKKIDAWGIGCILFALFNFKYPYNGQNRKDVRESIQNINLDIELQSLQYEIKTIIKGLLEFNCEKRLYITEANKIFLEYLEKNFEKKFIHFHNEKINNVSNVEEEIIFFENENIGNEKYLEKIPKNILKF